MSDRLDEETEAAIAELDRTARVSDACECYLVPGALADDPCIHVRENAEAESALRQRIRVLVSEARNIGYDSGFSDSRSLNSDPIPASLSIKANGS